LKHIVAARRLRPIAGRIACTGVAEYNDPIIEKEKEKEKEKDAPMYVGLQQQAYGNIPNQHGHRIKI
jgi:hypothetical protein